MLGDDRARQPREKGQARQGHLGPALQHPAFHELQRRPQSPFHRAGRQRGAGPPVGQDQAGIHLRS